MSKTVTVLLIAAAAVAVVLLVRKQTATPVAKGAETPPPPQQPTLGGAVANAFDNLAAVASNWASQWIKDRFESPPLVTERAPPVTGKAATPAVPAGSGILPLISPVYLA